MTAQALIFDLSAFPGMQVVSNTTNDSVRLDAARLLDEAVGHGLPCALISELPYRQAKLQLRRHFGDTAHHIFSVVLTGANFKERGPKSPYSVVLKHMGVPPDDALAVTASPHAIAAARTARIGVQAARDTGREKPSSARREIQS